MENLRYTENEIQQGIKYMIDNNYLEECISYNFTIEDITNRGPDFASQNSLPRRMCGTAHILEGG